MAIGRRFTEPEPGQIMPVDDPRAFLPLNPPFPNGTLVCLKGGRIGPTMMVENFRIGPTARADDYVDVVWFDTKGHAHRDAFHKDALVRVDE